MHTSSTLTRLANILRDPAARFESCERSLSALSSLPSHAIASVLFEHGIDQLVLHTLENEGLLEAIPSQTRHTLTRARHRMQARTWLQEDALDRLAQAFEHHHIRWVALKGSHLRNLIYDPSHLRHSVDIDILVDTQARQKALGVLAGLGFRGPATQHNDTHELALSDGKVAIDLHWQCFRPGHCRSDLSEYMLTNRVVDERARAYPNAQATMVFSLLHTAFTEYVAGRLVRLVDVDRLIRHARCNWQECVDWLHSSGVRTAAWATLALTQHYLGTRIDETTLCALAPGRLRRSYLKTLLRSNPLSLYKLTPTLAQLGVSLPMHDNLYDAARFLGHRARERFRSP